MNKRLMTLAAAFAAVVGTTCAQGQFYKIRGLEAGASATGRYVTPISNENSVTPQPTEGVGLLVTLRAAPKSWLGLEANYGLSHDDQRYFVQGGKTTINTFQHEATLGYVIHVKTLYGLQPFVVIGGGATDFQARGGVQNQWRGVGMYEVGFDYIPKRSPNVGFRIQQHALLYKAPDFYVDSLRSNTWVHQSSPAAGVFVRF
jgi:hypothetical protein